ncbi:MAG: hypothetical protein N3B21_15380 [Clostridia bacterium]|nr:hypothetical protein [Clostridia bacterium]
MKKVIIIAIAGLFIGMIIYVKLAMYFMDNNGGNAVEARHRAADITFLIAIILVCLALTPYYWHKFKQHGIRRYKDNSDDNKDG